MHERKHKEVINRTGTHGGYLRPVQKDVTELSRIRGGCTYKRATAASVRVLIPRRTSRGMTFRAVLVSEDGKRGRDKIVLIYDDGNALREY